MQNQQGERSDEELIKLIVKGDNSAFTLLVKRHQRGLYGFINKMISSNENTEDIIQETFVAVFKGAGQFEGKSLVKTWIYSIARNQALMSKRLKANEPAHFDSLEKLSKKAGFGEQLIPDKITRSLQIKNCISNAIDKLESSNKEILILRDIEGFSGDSVSQILGISTEAMKSRLHRARLLLMEQLLKMRCNDEV
ncbi:MAG: sigma-70 family RNA polymerase sigma factor [Deltaproteobacteria bacterium]|nr:sigma-70 family RNA polymerase sigma factor [Deltaproteobacteria bacterium]